MKDQLTDEQSAAILKALNEAIETGPWEESSFLRVIGKNLQQIRDEFIGLLSNRNQAQLRAESNLANRVALRSGQQEVYISLYSADGSNIQSWEKIVTNLPRQMISRPIYADEENIKDILKIKEHKINEAYVAIYINKDDILSLGADKLPKDKLGNTLLNLKDKTLNLDNISRFVHVTGVYRFERGHLIKN